MTVLRPYQSEAIDAVLQYWQSGGGNPLVDMATGTGKSVVIAKLVRDIVEKYPSFRVLMLTHVKELVAQNFQTLLREWPSAPAGIYAAGLNKRDAHHRITFASIQSVHRKAEALGRRDLVLIDESHLVPSKGQGMYLSLLDDMRTICSDFRVVGFTATPYRLDTGRLDSGTDRIFHETVYSYGIAQGIEDGYLSNLISRASATEIDVSDVARRGGEFVPGQLENAAEKITKQAVSEIVSHGKNRKAWLVFCSGVDHAFNVRNEIRKYGISCETVTGKTPKGERDSIIQRFRNGDVKCLTNANLLTTGFDVPHVDMIAMLRATLSTGLFVQICGRGTRLSSGKENCLILDFAGNCRRHGPVDAVSINAKGGGADDVDGKVSVDSVKAKACPECEELTALNTRECKGCGYEWPREEKPKHDAHADAETGILSTERVKPTQAPIVDWEFARHQKMGSPDSLRVTYTSGITEFREWLAFEHTGYAQQKAYQWWALHGGGTPFPRTITEAIERSGELVRPASISVKREGKYFNIVNRSFQKEEREVA